MGLFSSSRQTTDVDVVAENNIEFAPNNFIDIDLSAFLPSFSQIGSTLDRASNTIDMVLSNGVWQVGNAISSLGNGVQGAGVNIGFGLMLGVGTLALAYVLSTRQKRLD